MEPEYLYNRLTVHFLEQLQNQKISSMVRKSIQPYKELMSYYSCAMMEVEMKFKVLSEELSMRDDRNPIESIRTRLKTPESIREKMVRKGYPLTVESIEENLHDIAGVRVICSFPSDIYTLAEALLKQDDVRLIEKKDYIKHPKANGSRSLHLIVEIPIFPPRPQENHEGGGATQNHFHGLVGQLGTDDSLQKRLARFGLYRKRTQRMRGNGSGHGCADGAPVRYGVGRKSRFVKGGRGVALFKKFEKKTQKGAENNAADTSVMKAQFKKVQIVAVISFAIALIAIFLSVKEHVTIESLTAGVEGNSARAAGFLWLLFAIKSLSVVIPLPSLYLASGLLFQPVKAVCISYVGLAITLTIPYILGRWAGGEGIDYITANYPKIEKVLEFQKKNEFFANFIVRLIGWFPCDILSFYFGASKTPYITYLTASLIGCSIGVVTNTLLGDVILNPLSKPFILLMLIKIAISAAAIAAVYFLNKGKSDGKSED